jgi:hypothetical protein
MTEGDTAASTSIGTSYRSSLCVRVMTICERSRVNAAPLTKDSAFKKLFVCRESTGDTLGISVRRVIGGQFNQRHLAASEIAYGIEDLAKHLV